MHSLLDNWLGVITNNRYKIEVIKTGAPKSAHTSENWFYITKTYYHGEDGQHSIGLSEHELLELIDILNNAKARNCQPKDMAYKNGFTLRKSKI